MENCLIVTEKLTFSNKKLTSSMNTILGEYRKMQKGSENVAKALKTIKDNNLWVDDFDTFEQCIDTFGIGKSQAYRLIASYSMKYNEEHDGRLENYTLTQVAEIMRLETSLFCDVIDRGEISESMSCASIRDVVNKYKAKDETPADEVTNDVAGEEIPEELPEDIPEEISEDEFALYVCLGSKELPLTNKDLDDLEKWLTKRGYL